MILRFKGRTVLQGTIEGKALVTRRGFNTYASFFTSIHKQTGKAVCADTGNPDLYGKNLAHRIICLPGTTGSTSSGAVWQRLVKLGSAPKAMLFSQPIDPLAAGGLIIADIWAGKRIITIDQLGEAFINAVEEDDFIKILASGQVTVYKNHH